MKETVFDIVQKYFGIERVKVTEVVLAAMKLFFFIPTLK